MTALTMKPAPLFLFIALACVRTWGQGIIDSTMVPAANILRQESFDGSGLWGYIDGGADVYLEYGFSKVYAYEILYREVKLSVDAYEMTDEKAAFGVHSITAFHCLPDEALGVCDCVTQYHNQFCRANYFVRIVHDEKSDKAAAAAAELTRLLKEKIPAGGLTIPSFFSDSVFSPYLRSLKYVRGKLGVQNGLPDWEGLFQGVDRFEAYALSAADAENECSIGLVIAPDSAAARRLLQNNATQHSGGAPERRLAQIGDNTVIAIENVKGTKFLRWLAEQTK